MIFKEGYQRFFHGFWPAFVMLLVFVASFALYVQSEQAMDRANESRFQSRVLAGELRRSSDDLTRMARNFVVTGEQRYKKHYQEIMDIRDGKIARPVAYRNIYWDFILPHGQTAKKEKGEAIPLLDLVRRAGFNDQEYAKLAQAKINSDALAKIEFAAMDLVGANPSPDAQIRERAYAMLFDGNYHEAKAEIMQPIDEFYQLTEARTSKEVQSARELALNMRVVVILFGLSLIYLLWRAYQALFKTLGSRAEDIQVRLMRLGRGDFSTKIVVPEGLQGSVMGWLAVTQQKLAEIDAQRSGAMKRNQRLTNLYNALSQCNQAIVRCNDESELFAQICRDTVIYGGVKFAWIGMLDHANKQIKPVAFNGEGESYLKEAYISFDVDSEFGGGPSGIAARENRACWCQDFQHDPATAAWHQFGQQYGWFSSAALPLHRNGEVVGTFNLYADMVDAFDQDARRLLIEMSADISFALNRFVLEESRQHSMQMEALRIFMLERTHGTAHLNEILREVVLFLETIIPHSLCSILLLDQDGVHMRAAATPSLPDFFNVAIDGLAIGEGVGSCGTAMHTGLRTIVENIATHPYWDNYKLLAERAGLASCWSEPIRSSNNKTMGAFAIYHRAPTYPSQFQLQLLEMAAHFIGIAMERKQSEATLRKLTQAVEQSANAIIITDTDANIEYVNAAFISKSGKSLAEVVGHKSNILKSGKTSDLVYQDMWSHLSKGESWQGELINRYQDDSEHIELVQISPVRDDAGVVTNFLSIQEDITEKKRAEARIEYLAHFDALTGLPNRSSFDERAKYVLGLCKRNKNSLALLFIDLDHFKDINDTLGHNFGDLLLVELAGRLMQTLRESDIASRLGGDEFVLLLPGDDAVGAERVVEKLMQIICAPYRIEQHELNITASIGIAIFPDDGESLESLIRSADVAMYCAKQDGRNAFSFFTHEMQARSAHHLELTNALRQALSRDQLHVVYQPQISIDGEHVIGAEALLRWQHPTLGAISPVEFIPLAEESGLILPIGEWVLRSAVRQVKQWHAQGHTGLTMAVNLSAVQFRHKHLPHLVSSILQEADLAPHFLELELTEGVAMFDPQGAIEVMNDLHKRGIRMSIDDFGTGYSSLNYLKKFKVYKLKIDQTFVRDISIDSEDKAIVSAIIGIAKSLGLQTIAEGVETAEQLEYLRSLGCDEIQGYYFSRPLPAADFDEYLARKK